MEAHAFRPPGPGPHLELAQHRLRERGRDDPEHRLDERLRIQALRLALPVVRARPSPTRFPVGEVLDQAAAPLPAVRRVPVDLDEAEDLRDAPEEAEPGAL